MRFYYDLHIHTVLSPCADVLMTPHNIFNMATLKGLDIIAITDHNSAKQLPICEEIAQSYDLLFVPGIEVEVQEGFHVLIYFKSVNEAMRFDQILEPFIDKKEIDLSIYNEQSLTNINDETIETIPHLLTAPTQLSFRELLNILNESFEYVIGYAHLDRTKHSGLVYCHQYELNFVEVTKHVSESFIDHHYLDRYPIMMNSDAHQIMDISEKNIHNYIELNELSIDSLFRYFHHG